MGEEVQAFDYHSKMDAYVIGTSLKTDFKLPEDEFHDNWTSEGEIKIFLVVKRILKLAPDISFLPQIDHGTVKLLDHETWTTIDQ